MKMGIFQIWLDGTPVTEGKGEWFHLIEIAADDLDDFLSLLADPDVMIKAQRLTVRRDPECANTRLVRFQNEIAFRAGAVKRVEVPTWRFVKTEEAAAA